MVVVPHPDDESLSTGGLIAHQRRAGVEVVIVAVSDGEAAYPGRPTPGLADRRRREHREALAALGVAPTAVMRCGLPDGEVAAHHDALLAVLQQVVEKGDLLVAPWLGDHHTDHIACARAAMALDTPGTALLGSMFWALHHSSPTSAPSTGFLRLDLDAGLRAAKGAGLAAHRSQLPGDGPHSVLNPALLRPVLRPFELFAGVR